MKRYTEMVLGFVLFIGGSIIFWIQIDSLKNPEAIEALKSAYFGGIILVSLFAFLENYKPVMRASKTKEKVLLSLALVIFFGASYFLLVRLMK